MHQTVFVLSLIWAYSILNITCVAKLVQLVFVEVEMPIDMRLKCLDMFAYRIYPYWNKSNCILPIRPSCELFEACSLL